MSGPEVETRQTKDETGMFAKKAQTVMGHRIPEPRPTLMAVALVVLYVGLPLLVVTGLLDLAMQVFFGVCTGLWCLA
jgi:thiosulfate reductase cytochrome b subunit